MSFIVKNQLASFSELTKLGIKNFCTFDNQKWGDMSLYSNPYALNKYQELFEAIQIDSEKFINLSSQHTDNIVFLTKQNLKVYESLSKSREGIDLRPITIFTDCLITKTSIPVVMTCGDGPILIISGIDKIDNKRFILAIYATTLSTILKIVEKSVKNAAAFYEFNNSDLEVFIFPHISSENYKKHINDANLFDLKDDPDWKNFINEKDSVLSIDLKNKITHDLNQIGIDKIDYSNIDTFQANQDEKLFSQIYLRSIGQNHKKRFAVVIQLNQL